MEAFYPLHVFVCEHCFLVQLEEYVSPEHIFTEYAYFSSYSDSWLAHAKAYTELMVERFQLGQTAWSWNWPAMTATCCSISLHKAFRFGHRAGRERRQGGHQKGLPTLVRFFGAGDGPIWCDDGNQADLIVGNNVLAQVPDLCTISSPA